MPITRRDTLLGLSIPLPSAASDAGSSPIRQQFKRVEFRAEDFGVIGDGVANDQPAIARMLQAARASQATAKVLIFPGNATFRVTTTGAHGLHVAQLSNVTITFGPNATLLMDNMKDGLATSHGVFIEGPCANIVLQNVHVAYDRMTRSRQSWAPFYFLGANVGNGEASGWYRGSKDHDDWERIAAGACRDIQLSDCSALRSPSVFVGLVGVDGCRIRNFLGDTSWADGLYHVFFRRSVISDTILLNSGDDTISLASYESDTAAADIETPFHGEGTVITNVVIDGQHPSLGANSSGCLAFLGVRDVVVSNINASNRFRGVRFEIGTNTGRGGNPDIINQSLSFLACRRITLSNASALGVVQGLSVVNKEQPYTADPKWWRHQGVCLSNMTLTAGASASKSTPVDIGGIYGGASILCGFSLDNVVARSFSTDAATLGPLEECRIDGLDIDGPLTITGLVAGPDNGGGDNSSDTHIAALKVRGLIIRGMKGATFQDLSSSQAAHDGLIISNSSDLSFGSVAVSNCNRSLSPLPGNGCVIDQTCRQITMDRLHVAQDATPISNAIQIDSKDLVWIRTATVVLPSDQATSKVIDRARRDDGRSQIGRLELPPAHNGQTWRQIDAPNAGLFTNSGDGDFDLDPTSGIAVLRITNPLTRDTTVTLRPAEMIGQTLEVARLPGATGPFKVTIHAGAADNTALASIPPDATGSVRARWNGTGYDLTDYSIFSRDRSLIFHPDSDAVLTRADVGRSHVWDARLTVARSVELPPGNDGDRVALVQRSQANYPLQVLTPDKTRIHTFDPNTTGFCDLVADTHAGWIVERRGSERSAPLVTVDPGNTEKTLVAGRDSPVQIFKSPLTTDCHVVLSSENAGNGDTFRIVRSVASDHKLVINGLRTIPAGSSAWAEVTFDGKDWTMTGYGQL